MTIRPITIAGHRALSQRTRRVREVTDELRALVADMFETNDAANGAGLAAPQVGSRWRLFVYSCEDASGTLRRGVVINPVLERFGGIELDEETLEGCLSVPGEGFPTARHRGARVRGTDLEGAEVVVEDEGGVPVAHVYELDGPTGAYAPAGIFRGTLERPVPFGIRLDLDGLVPRRRS